jgi:hypothetical protein
MTWRPSTDEHFDVHIPNEFFSLIEPGYDAAFPMASLSRGDDTVLARDYIHVRKHDSRIGTESMRSRLPPALADARLGPTEIDLIDFLIHRTSDRAMNIVGPRGSGKTTLLHYVESVLRKALPDAYPILLIVDCNPFGNDAQTRDFLGALGIELEKSAAILPPPFDTRAAHAAKTLADDPTQLGLHHALRTLVKDLSPAQMYRPTIVFDNLDQLSSSVVNVVLSLVKALSSGTGLTAIACLRPGSYSRAFGSGDAQALFGFQIRIQPPDTTAWLLSLPKRVSNALPSALPPDARLRAFGVDLTLAQIESVLASCVSQLCGRKTFDDPAIFLEALCADDMRHLVKLVRRLLAHRDAPFESLVGTGSPKPFHPLTAMFEGQRIGFADDDFVPNVLVHDRRDGAPDFLLCQRLLLLLRQRPQTNTQVLLEWLQMLDVPRVDAVMCLDRLQRSLLVRCSNADFIDMQGPLPSEVWLTAAGRLYLKAVFRLADYLLAAIIDVPLRHRLIEKAFRTNSRDLRSARIDSLLEYVEEVRKAEEKEIRILRDTSPSGALERVLYVLQHGGLLSSLLAGGLKEVAERYVNHSSESMRRSGADILRRLPALEAWCESAERRLEELRNRTRRPLGPSARTIPLAGDSAEVLVKPIDHGDSVTLRLDIRSGVALTNSLVLLDGYTSEGRVLEAAVVRPKPKQWQEVFGEKRALSKTMQAVLGPFPFGGFEKESALKSQLIALSDIGAGRRFGVLTVLCEADTLQLKLSLDDGEPAVLLGPKTRRIDVTRLVTDKLGAVSVLLAAGKGVGEEIDIVGGALAYIVLSSEGRARIAACMDLVDTLLLVIDPCDLETPWEWMLGDGASGKARRKVVRWTTDSFAGAMKVQREGAVGGGPYSTLTMGLTRKRESAWRREIPAGHRTFSTERL